MSDGSPPEWSTFPSVTYNAMLSGHVFEELMTTLYSIDNVTDFCHDSGMNSNPAIFGSDYCKCHISVCTIL